MTLRVFAKRFEDATQGDKPACAIAFRDAKKALGQYAGAPGFDPQACVQDSIRDEAAQQKALKKFAEWGNKGKQPKGNADVSNIETVFKGFERAFLATCKDPRVIEMREAKEAFKREVTRLYSEMSREELEKQLVSCNDKVIARIGYWTAKIDRKLNKP